MASARRPDSWLALSGPPTLISGPPPLSDEIGKSVTSIESLSGFVSEAQPPATAAPAVVVSSARDAAQVASDVTPPARPHREPAATAARARTPVVRPRSLAVSAALIAFAVAASSAIIITLLGGFDRSSALVPPISEAVTPTIPASSPASPALPPDSRWAVDAVMPDPPRQSARQSSPVVAIKNRAVGTSGRRTAEPNQATRTSRAPATSYRGSLAIRSAPLGARVFVNGALVGSTPLVLDNMPVGSRAIRIEADGYKGWSASTRIVANQQTRLSTTLERAAP